MTNIEMVQAEPPKPTWIEIKFPNGRVGWQLKGTPQIVFDNPNVTAEPVTASRNSGPAITQLAPPQEPNADNLKAKLKEASTWKSASHQGQQYWYNEEQQFTQWECPSIVKEIGTPQFQALLQAAKAAFVPQTGLGSSRLQHQKLLLGDLVPASQSELDRWIEDFY